MMLRIGVSLAAIALAAPALAADKVVRAPVPTADRGEFRAFVEGWRVWTAATIPYGTRVRELGDPILLWQTGEMGPAWDNASSRSRVGWDAAVGFDYRFAGPPGTSICKRAGVRRGEAPP